MLKVEAYLRRPRAVDPSEHLTEGMRNIVGTDTDRLEVKFNRYISEDELSRGIDLIVTKTPTRVIHRVKVRIEYFDDSSAFRTYLVETDNNTSSSPFNAACLLVRKDFGMSPSNIDLIHSTELGELRKV